MMRYNVIIFILFLASSFSAIAQVDTQPVQPHWFYYWPTEDADNFENSKLGTSSLGSGDLKRKSNIEVNKQPEEAEVPVNVSNQPSSIDSGLAAEPSVNVNSRPVSSSRLIKWTDDEGVVHVTNNPDSVPDKYKDQIME